MPVESGKRYELILRGSEQAAMDLTSRISVSVIEPCKSCLLAKTRRDAPAKR